MAQTRAAAEGWQIEPDSAEAYERYLVPAMMARWAEQLVDLAAPRPGERVLDLGCGTGVVARTAARAVGRGGSVTGLDLNEGMLAAAQAAAARQGLAVEWRAGNATALPFPGASFDVVLSQQALQFVSDPAAALREAARVLRPQGRLALNVCRPLERCPAYVHLAEALGRHLGPAAAAGMRSPFRDWSVDDLRGLLAGAGLREVRVRIEVSSVRYPSVSELVRREASSSPLAGPVAALSTAAREALLRELEEALRGFVDDEGFVTPLELYLASGRR